MKKRFNAKKKKKLNIKLIIILFIASFTMTFCFAFKTFGINIDDQMIVSYILKSEEDFTFSKITSPEFLLNYTFNATFVFEEEEILDTPTVYIYNTHPTEYYADETVNSFNITPTVISASYMLKEYLNEYNIIAIVEEESVTDLLYEYDWSYSMSYDASKELVLKAMAENPSLVYFIDLHRDAISKDVSTVEIGDEYCAKLMLVVGGEHEDYEKNLDLANNLYELLNDIDENFSRGVSLKTGSGINGIYNQDLSENAMLVEVGGQYNTIEEVNCSMKYLASALSILMNGE